MDVKNVPCSALVHPLGPGSISCSVCSLMLTSFDTEFSGTITFDIEVTAIEWIMSISMDLHAGKLPSNI